MNTKRLLSAILTFTIILSIVSSTFASASETGSDGYYSYSITNGCATITSVDESISGNIVIPDTLGGAPVTQIGDEAFSQCNNIFSVIIPNSVTTIGYQAFGYCDNLANISIPEEVVSIGRYAFYSCQNLSNINIPKGITSIDKYTFGYCKKLSNINIPSSVTTIKAGAFNHCENLNSVIIPDSVTNIGSYAFADCYGLKNITIPQSVVHIDDYTFEACGKLKSIILPDTITQIDFGAFKNCNELNDIYYHGTEDRWREIKIGSVNTCLTSANIHFNSSKSTLIKKQYNEEDEIIVIYPYAFDTPSGKEFIHQLSGVTPTAAVGDFLEFENAFSILKEKAVFGDITLSCPGFKDYIIPIDVIKNLQEDTRGSGTYSLKVFMHRNYNNESAYISSVYVKEGDNDGQFTDIQTNRVFLKNGIKYDFHITSKGLDNQNIKYYIAQSEDKCISNNTGIFSTEELYELFDFDATVYVFAFSADGTIANPTVVNLFKSVDFSKSTEFFINSKSISLFGDKGLELNFSNKYIPLIDGTQIKIDGFNSPVGIDISGSTVRISVGLDIFDANIEDVKGDSNEDNTNNDNISNEENATNNNNANTSSVGTATDNAETKNTNPPNKTKPNHKLVFEDFKKQFQSINEDLSDNAKDKIEIQKKYSDFKNKFATDHKLKNYGDPKTSLGCSLLGYIEGEIINGELIIRDVLVAVNGEIKYQYTGQLVTSVGPMYYGVEFEVPIALEATWGRVSTYEKIPFEFDLALNVEPSLKLSGGYGINNLASVGLYGKGTAPISADFTNKQLSIFAKGELGFEFQFVVLGGSIPIASNFDEPLPLLDHYYWGDDNTSQVLYANNSVSSLPLFHSEDNSTLTMSISTEQKTGSFESDLLAITSLSQQHPKIISFETIDPETNKTINNMIMVWVEICSGGVVDKYTRLVYSVFDSSNNTWSKSKAVFDDYKNDSFPSVVSDGTDVYIAWQKNNKIIMESDTITLNDLLENGEIFFARYDSANDKFTDVTQITENDYYDYSPMVAISDTGVNVYYASCLDNNLSGTQNNEIWCYSTSTNSNIVIAGDLNYILSMEASDNSVSYTMDTNTNYDSEKNTIVDINVFSVIDSAIVPFDDVSSNSISAMHYGMLCGVNKLFVSDGNNIYYTENNETKTVFQKNRTMREFIGVINTDAKTNVVWSEESEEGTVIMSVYYSEGIWSSPVKIGGFNTEIYDVSIALFNNSIYGACNSRTSVINEGDGTSTTEIGLHTFYSTDFYDLEAEYILPVSESDIMPGQEASLSVALSNNGTLPIENIVFSIADGSGAIQTATTQTSLASGEREIVDIVYLVPENYNSTTINITASIEEILGVYTEPNTDNNTASITIGQCDLEVSVSEVIAMKEHYIINAVIENTSAKDAKNVTLSVIPNEKEADTIKTINSIGTVVNEGTENEHSVLDRDSYINIDIILDSHDLETITCDENGAAKVYLKLESDSSDALESDNIICVILVPYKDTVCAHPIVKVIQGKPADCLNSGWETYEVCTVCSEIASEKIEIPAINHTNADGSSAWGETYVGTDSETGNLAYLSNCLLCGYVNNISDIILGDVNVDGSVDSTDYSIMSRFLRGINIEIDTIAADINKNGTIDSVDVAMLKRFLKGASLF